MKLAFETISIVTPSYNQGRFIERTLRSVLNQNIPELEYIVFDGCSRDETLSILRRYDNRVRWVSEPDHGQAHAVNKGIAVSHGEIIGWLNSDDIYYPGALEKVQRYFCENPAIDVVYGDAFHIDIDDNPIEPYYTEPWNFERFLSVCFLCQPAVFFRRRVVGRFGLLDESLRFCMDYEFWLRLAKNGAIFAYLPEPLAGSRMYIENKTLSQRVAVHAEINDMMKKRFGKVPTKWLLNYAHARVRVGRLRKGWSRMALLALHSVLASLRWNHEISKDILQHILSWIRERKK
jgi:glycosyltransferase involved in cell wall biosynthesis